MKDGLNRLEFPLLFVRHGSYDYDPGGDNSDPELNEAGRAQAVEAAKRIEAMRDDGTNDIGVYGGAWWGEHREVAVLTSSARRAAQTADIICHKLSWWMCKESRELEDKSQDLSPGYYEEKGDPRQWIGLLAIEAGLEEHITAGGPLVVVTHAPVINHYRPDDQSTANGEVVVLPL